VTAEGESRPFSATRRCNVCHRSVTARLSADDVRDLVGWEFGEYGTDPCPVCLCRRSTRPGSATGPLTERPPDPPSKLL
jgi:hypothetical protein